MSKRTRVMLVRHGETVWNTEGRLQGHLDSPLTDRGVAQAEATASRLGGIRIDALYSSDLGRALGTAKRIGQATDCPIIPEPRLRERALGVFEGLDTVQIRSRYPEEWERFTSRDPDFRVPRGESSRERVERTRSLLEEVAETHAGGTVLLVTHGGILDAVFRLVVGLPLETPRTFKIWNAGLNLISRTAGEPWMIELWGDTGSLVDGATLDDT